MKYVYVFAVLVCATLVGCDSHRDAAQLASIQPPRFTDADFSPNRGTAVKYECDMTAESASGRLLFQGEPPPGLLPGFMTIRQKPSMPKFYKGKSLHYILTETTGRGYTYGNPVPLSHEFSQFTTEFVITNGLVMGARTKSKGILVAEAKVEYYVKNLPDGTGDQGIRIREYHFDDGGTLVFTCVSEIDQYSGFKLSESEALGKKRTEYYFLWPRH